MVAISFSVEGFVEKIRSGAKSQTIRPFNQKRYEQIERIKKLQLYWKQRTKECFKIADAELTEIFKIKFVSYFDYWGDMVIVVHKWDDGWREISAKELIELSFRDGFVTVWDFLHWFENQYREKLLKMEFMVIRWKLEGEK